MKADHATDVDSRPLIAHVVYRFDVGGLENGVVNLLNRMPAERYRHAVLALTEVTPFRAPGAARRCRVRRPAQDPWARHQAVPEALPGVPPNASGDRAYAQPRSAGGERPGVVCAGTDSRPWRARARRRRSRRNESDLPMGPAHAPAFRHAVRRAVAGPRALPDGFDRRACAAGPADHQRRRHRGVHAGRDALDASRMPVRRSATRSCSEPSDACRR